MIIYKRATYQGAEINRKKIRHVAFVEHVFGFEEQTMRGLVVRTVGLYSK